MEKARLQNKITLIIQITAIMLMGVYSMMCVYFHRYFAKIHILLGGADGLPIFIGEIVLAVCVILLAMYWIMLPLRLNRWHWLLAAAIIFVAVKTLLGYRAYGALAFRNAALFYYPFFGVIGYYFYNRRVFNQKTIITLFAVILAWKILGGFFDYFLSTYLFLLLAIAFKIRNKWVRYSGLLITFFTPNYRWFFLSTRTIILGNLFAFIFVFTSLIFVFLPIKKQYKGFILATVLSIFGFFIFLKMDRNAFESMLVWGKLRSEYQRLDNEYRSKADNFAQISAQVKLFSNEEMPFSPPVVLQEAAVSVNKEGAIAVEQPGGSIVQPVEQSGDAIVQPLASRNIFSQESIRDSEGAFNNILERLFIWQDALEELYSQQAFWGVGFGKPLLPKRIIVLGWGTICYRMGWVEPHNSYIDIIYRAGIAGIFFIAALSIYLVYLIRQAIKKRLISGVLLTGILLYWAIVANFGVILELPYYAVPFWSLVGLIAAYINGIAHIPAKP